MFIGSLYILYALCIVFGLGRIVSIYRDLNIRLPAITVFVIQYDMIIAAIAAILGIYVMITSKRDDSLWGIHTFCVLALFGFTFIALVLPLISRV